MERLDLTKFVTQGRRWKDVRTYTIQWLHKLFNYIAEEYGEFIVSVEDPGVLGLLKLRWIVLGRRVSSDYNYRVARFSSSLAKAILDTARKLGVKTVEVDPKGTSNSKEHEYTMRKYGLDKHTASAYLIALRGKLQQKHMRNI